MVPDLHRDELLADQSLVGAVFCRAYARRVDEWLQAIYEQRLGDRSGLALVALGGYGRSTLSPNSDLDLMLLHSGWNEDELADAAQLMWFPIWDEHLDLGHAVRTITECVSLARDDLDTATSLLSLRHLAGDADLVDDLAEQAARSWRKSARTRLPELEAGARQREIDSGEVAFLLEPDLKHSRGGLRDVNTVDWVEAAGVEVLPRERCDLRSAYEVLLAARVELHRSTRRKGDRLLLEEQDAVADVLGYADADELMSRIAQSARTVTWITDDVFGRASKRVRRFRKLRSGRPKKVDRGVEVFDGLAMLGPDADVANDAGLALRLGVAAAEHDARLDHDSLEALVAQGPAITLPLSPELRELFVRLLRAGSAAIPVIETLDHVGLFTRFLPEWEPTRSKVQRNQYHRFTVDRHLLEASANAVAILDDPDEVSRIDRPDLLLVGALLHDIGKGYPGDHTDVGVELIATIGPNLGFDESDTMVLQRLCEHHLLIPDAATRRDIEDPGTIQAVAEQVETPDFLRLLTALTEADSIATGPSAWSSWKAHLITELSRSVEAHLTDGQATPGERSFPDDSHLALLAAGVPHIEGVGDTLTVVAPDRPGLFSRIAGALSLSNLNIIGAQTHVEHGHGLDVIRVVDADDDELAIEWAPVEALVEQVLSHDEDLLPRFEARRASAVVRQRQSPVPIEAPRVSFDNEISADSTVIEVAGPDRLGLLYEISRAVTAAGLDSSRAHVQTVGDDVVDSFYVKTLDGAKFTDGEAQEQLRSTLLAILSPPD